MEIIKNDENKIKYFKMSSDEFKELRDEYSGLCFSCGEQNYSVEPDARKYECESCEESKVYGIEEILIMGRILITDDEEINS